MPVPLEQFVKHLEDSGILAGDTLQDFVPPRAFPKDAQDLARELVRRKKLTRFQAEEAYNGKAKALVLGNYVLVDKIGAGGMGQVFKAEHRRMDRVVAVKLLPAAMTEDKAAIARFEREVKAAARISHPNIVTAHDADQANGVHFLVMEFVEGSDLSACVKKNGPIPVEKAVNYILQAAKGLEAAHKKGIVHRDIKPANLLLDKDGTVKVLDMGLARIDSPGDAASQTELTNTGAVMGTVDFMSPEQALDTKAADARADIYSLGCSLFYLLTGKATYPGDTVMKKILAHREMPIPSLRGISPDVPERVELVFTKMVAKRIEDRYRTMTQLLVDLEECCKTEEQTVDFRGPTGPVNTAARTNLQPQVVRPRPAPAGGGKQSKKWALVGTGVLGALILLAGVVVKLRTRDGTLIVTVHEPNAQVEVLNEQGKIEVSRKGETGTISINVDPGKHRLRVTRDGFTVFGRDFEIDAGGKRLITAELVPLGETPATAETKPVPVVGVKRPLAFETPGFDQWVKEVAALPAAQQVEAVSRKLVELNPGFDGKVTGHLGEGTPLIENGVVTQFGFDNVNATRSVTDLSPLRALRGLSSLWCGLNAGQLADLSPLTGMPLVTLVCPYTRITDLSPLAGMKLQVLDCGATQVSDLSPLKGMPLGLLCVANTPVSDISVLQGMTSLQRLMMTNSRVTDLRPIRGMRLDHFTCDGVPVSDLSLLKDMPLKHLACDFKPERDTELLHSFKDLETINRKPAAEFWKEVEGKKEEEKGQ